MFKIAIFTVTSFTTVFCQTIVWQKKLVKEVTVKLETRPTINHKLELCWLISSDIRQPRACTEPIAIRTDDLLLLNSDIGVMIGSSSARLTLTIVIRLLFNVYGLQLTVHVVFVVVCNLQYVVSLQSVKLFIDVVIFVITACAIATSCCISDVPSQWEGRNFDLTAPTFSTDFNETWNQERYPRYEPTGKIWLMWNDGKGVCIGKAFSVTFCVLSFLYSCWRLQFTSENRSRPLVAKIAYFCVK